MQAVRRSRLTITSAEGHSWVDRLVEQARSGDRAAFEALAERSLPEVYRLATAMVGPDDAADVAQEALIAAWRELPTLRRAEKFDSWLRSIVMNRARNVLRMRRRRPAISLIEGGLPPLADPTLEADGRLAVQAAFEGLRVEQREVLVLHYVLDLRLREVADIVGVPEGTAKSRLHAGLQILRERFREP